MVSARIDRRCRRDDRTKANLHLVSASFFVRNAVQRIAAGELRGLKDTRVPLLLTVVVHWLIGFSMSYVLGLWIGPGALGIWIECQSDRSLRVPTLSAVSAAGTEVRSSEPTFDRVNAAVWRSQMFGV